MNVTSDVDGFTGTTMVVKPVVFDKGRRYEDCIDFFSSPRLTAERVTHYLLKNGWHQDKQEPTLFALMAYAPDGQIGGWAEVHIEYICDSEKRKYGWGQGWLQVDTIASNENRWWLECAQDILATELPNE